MSDATIRPMNLDDLPAAERLSAQAFHELDTRFTPRAWAEPVPRPPERSARWLDRSAHLLRTDPGGCWVAEDDTGMLGFATSFQRELTWFLSSYAVRPGLQGQGLGKALLAVTMEYGRGCLRAMVNASSDPRAVRRYRLAGLTLHPQMLLRGAVDRSEIPTDVGAKVRPGSPSDRDLLDSIDRQARGSAHGEDHALLQAQLHLRVSDTSTGSGYAYVDDGGGVQLLAATNRRTAARLLWDALAASAGEVEIPHVTAANEWAIDVALAARLEVHTAGYLALRGMRPPTPYLHHGSLL